MEVVPYIPEEIVLDSGRRSLEVMEFQSKLRSKIVGQNRAVRSIVSLYQTCKAGMASPGRPLGSLLFLGPTGSGKTHVVEAASEILFGDTNAFVKIDCAEYQHSHEIAKLIGSPPGYIGHRETQPALNQERINCYQTDTNPLTFVLFDEIEKANEALWQLLLGVLDKATLTLGDGRKVDFSRCIIIMTSNLGAMEISRMMSGGIGFTSKRVESDSDLAQVDTKIYRLALEVARRKFSPEFMNRIDKTVVFRTLNAEQLKKVLNIELTAVQNRITASQSGRQFICICTEKAKEFLLREGTDAKYGARPLRRAIDRHLVYPLANLIATGQVGLGDVVTADLAAKGNRLFFSKTRAATAFASLEAEKNASGSSPDGSSKPPETKAAAARSGGGRGGDNHH